MLSKWRVASILALYVCGTEGSIEMIEEEAESNSKPFYLLDPQDYAKIMGGMRPFFFRGGGLSLSFTAPRSCSFHGQIQLISYLCKQTKSMPNDKELRLRCDCFLAILRSRMC